MGTGVQRIWSKAGSWMVWGVGAILCLIFASYYGGIVPYAFLKLAFAIPVVGILYCIWVVSHFRFYQNVEAKTVVKGEPVGYSLCLSNEDWLEYGSVQVVYYENRAKLIGVEEQQCYTLPKGTKKEIHTSICCRYRGEYEVGVSYFIIKDYLELITMRYKPVSAFKVLVLPRIIPWEYEKEILDDKAGSNNARTLRNGELDVQVCNYNRGDSLHRIHWKASARMGRLMTRQECETRKKKLLVAMDLRPQGATEEEQLQYEDTMMEQLVAIVHTCLQRQIPCVIMYQESSVHRMEVSSQKQWKEFYEGTGKIRFTANQPVERIPALCEELSGLCYAVFLTHTISGEMGSLLSHRFGQITTGVVLIDKDTASLRCL